jgi:uncharacterized pyridoxamine 5'-phosphate oxidase family protein
MKIDFDSLKGEVLDFLEKNRTLILATCAESRVTARAMSCIHRGLTVYFQTDTRSVKFEQMQKNPRVALCGENVQIEGRVIIRSQPMEEPGFVELYKKHHPGSFSMYSRMKHNVVVEVRPTFVTFWKYVDNKPCRDFLYVDEGKAEREFYDID